MPGRIAVVDDNRGVVEFIGRKLKKQGYEVSGCVESVKAFEICKADRPDLVILDILMPGKDGWEVLKELRSDPETASIPVIISSVKNRVEDVEMGRELRVTDYIAKPYVFSDLLEKVNRILSQE